VTKPLSIRQANSAGRIVFDVSEISYLDTVNERHPELHINIETIDANGANRRRLTPGAVQYATPACSPDGSKIAFCIGNHKIGLMNADGTNQEMLVGNEYGYLSKCHSPCFSPDGKRIAFVAGGTRSWALFVMNADGSAPIEITHDCVPRNPVFSADGNQIIYDTGGLHTVDTNGGNQRELFSNNLTRYTNVAFNPAGCKIAFVERCEYWNDEDEYYHLYTVYVANNDGSELTKVSSAFRTAYDPTFSPDGKRIAFIGQLTEDATPGIYTTRLDGSDIEVVTHEAEDVSHLCWIPIRE
jgi:Tol biopolymer transport system component